MASSPERRTVEERWGAFSGAILGITVLTAALTGSIRAVFLWGVALLTLGCIYVFARTFVPLRALEATLFGFYRDWKRSRNPYWSGFMRSRGLPSTARGNVVYLCRATFIPENSTECPKAPDLKLRCEMNKFFHREKALCTDRWDTLGMLSFMVVPSRFITTDDGIIVLRKGRYVLRWYNEDTNLLIAKKHVRSWGRDPRNSWWRKFREHLSYEMKSRKGEDVPFPSSEDD
jgi:hypothetical protein